jgi:hypothetical protein
MKTGRPKALGKPKAAGKMPSQKMQAPMAPPGAGMQPPAFKKGGKVGKYSKGGMAKGKC